MSQLTSAETTVFGVVKWPSRTARIPRPGERCRHGSPDHALVGRREQERGVEVVHRQVGQDAAVLRRVEEPVRPLGAVELVRARGGDTDDVAQLSGVHHIECGERLGVTALLEQQVHGAVDLGGHGLDLVELGERGAQRLVGQHMGTGTERGDGIGATRSVDTGDHGDVDALGEQILGAVEGGNAEAGGVVLCDSRVGVLYTDELERGAVGAGQLVEHVVHVRMGGTDDRDPRHGRQ